MKDFLNYVDQKRFVLIGLGFGFLFSFFSSLLIFPLPCSPAIYSGPKKISGNYPYTKYLLHVSYTMLCIIYSLH